MIKRGIDMKVIRIILVVVLLVLILLIGGGIYGIIHITDLDTTYPNLTLNGIEVGNMTRDQVVQKLNESGWKDQISTPLTVTTIGGQSFEVDPLRSGLVLPAEQAADFAFSYGRDSNLIDNLLTYLECLVEPVSLQLEEQAADTDYLLSCIDENQSAINALLGDAEYVPDYEGNRLLLRKGWGQLRLDRKAVLNAVTDALRRGETSVTCSALASQLTAPDFQTIYNTLKQDPRDAAFTDDGRFEVIDEIVGCTFDINTANQLWANAAPAEEISIPMQVTWPAVTGQQLRDSLYRDLLGTCTTNYWNSTENRINNVQLASSKINGTILYPGDLFSYNEVVGTRTTEAGFLPAPAYVDGDVKDEIGGGACQVSSTLYAATLFAFLETVERTNHYFPVHYMQLGTDATVTIPDEGGNVMDLKFRNNRNYPIKIVAYSNLDEENYLRALTFEIWGTLEDGDYMPVQFDNRDPRLWEFNGDIWDVDPVDPNRPGYIIKLVHEQYYFSDDMGDGVRTITHRKVYNAGVDPNAWDAVPVYDEVLNKLLPSGGPAMDTYYDHY